MCLVMILVKKVFIFSKTMIICLLCPLLCGLFFFWKGAKGELSYKEIKSSPANSSRTSGVAKQNPNNSYPFLIFSADTKGSVNTPHPNEDAQ
mgnify:CR=1 FL=1